MYLTRAAGIETDFEYLFAFYFWKMYLTRVAGIETKKLIFFLFFHIMYLTRAAGIQQKYPYWDFLPVGVFFSIIPFRLQLVLWKVKSSPCRPPT